MKPKKNAKETKKKKQYETVHANQKPKMLSQKHKNAKKFKQMFEITYFPRF